MKANRNREDLIEVLGKFISIILDNSNTVEEIIAHLENKHGMDIGRLMYYFNDPTRLNEAGLSELALISEQISLKLEEAKELQLNNWFNTHEIKEIRQYYYIDENTKDKIELPLVLKNVLRSGHNKYVAVLDYKTIARLYKYGLLYYNFEIQREGRLKKVGNEVIQEVKIYKKNVKEIKDRVLSGKQEDTLIVYNCAVETSEDESEQELIYDEKDLTLTITKGTRIDILDGTHRTRGIYEAYMENPNIEGRITVQISNRTTAEARDFQVELSKATPINKARAKELALERYSDELVGRLKSEGMLKGRISSTNTVNRNLNQLTTSSILSDAFDKHWKPEKRSDIRNIMKEFNNYLEYLFEYYEDYVEDIDNLLFTKLFFIGHVILAKRMHDSNVSYDKLNEILDKLNFDKNTDMWKELNIVHDDRGMTSDNKTIRGIENLFKSIDI